MKKTITLLLVLGLIAGSLAAPAAAKKKKKKPVRVERVAEARYEFPSGIGSGSVGGACSGCPSLPAASGETWVKIEITDDLTPKAGVEFSPGDIDGDGFQDSGVYVCGSTDGWIEIPEGSQMVSFPWILPGTDCPDGSATSGTIKITYSSSPGK
jgi:hypothetical protein